MKTNIKCDIFTLV